ncbi:calcium-binding protein [Robiginitomaculum antarcticum]|uniref:calcium-binding protein n=1 Tax=Robiginitomaculum antarcticum TaxID=437507 RepID=UPI0003627555|nr:calcium-binding protein [Robiginitomaculum antarcticum]
MPLPVTPQIGEIEVFDFITSAVRSEGFSPTSVTQLSNGNIIVVYTLNVNRDYDVRFSIFDPVGNRVIAEQTMPDLGIEFLSGQVHAYDGGFLITYTPTGSNASNFLEYARFDNLGNNISTGAIEPLGDESINSNSQRHFVTADGTLYSLYTKLGSSGGFASETLILTTITNDGQATSHTEIITAKNTYLTGAVLLPDGNIMAISRSYQDGQSLAVVRYDIIDPDNNGAVISSGEYQGVSLFDFDATLTDNGVIFLGTVEDTGFFPTQLGFVEIGYDGSILTPQTIIPGNPQSINYAVLSLDDGSFLLVNSESGQGITLTNFDLSGAVLSEIVTIPNTGNYVAVLGAERLSDGRVIISYADNQGDIVTTTYDTRANGIVPGNSSDNDIVGTLDGDVLSGGLGADRLYGIDGNDVLDGGQGNDTLTGGSGADKFVFAVGDGQDIITDFDASLDVLELAISPYISMSQLRGMMSQYDGYVMMDIGAGQTIRLDGMMVYELTHQNFRLTGISEDGVGPFLRPSGVPKETVDTSSSDPQKDALVMEVFDLDHDETALEVALSETPLPIESYDNYGHNLDVIDMFYDQPLDGLYEMV